MKKQYRGGSALILIIAAAPLVLGMFAACSGGDPEPSPSPSACSPDLASIQERIFVPSCAQAGCHSANEPAVGLNLSGPDVAEQLIGVLSSTCDGRTRVVPGAAELSFLFEKITAGTPKCGLRMPLDRALSAEEVACVKGWIESLPASDAGPDTPDACETCGGGECVDLTSNAAHCGACGKACPPGAGCEASACACGGGLAACGEACVDTMLDQENCGGCGEACPMGAVCSGGQCACAAGLEVCGSACTDTASDPTNCGGCGVACGGGEVCNMGGCSMTCGALTKCGASCVDTDTSPANCGACGKACPAGASCAFGACLCPAGTSDCGGICINTTTDPANCGACGNACAQGTTCEAGACVCPGGGMICGASCADTQSDPANCGACGDVCAGGQACVMGACACGTASVSFASAVQPILTASCATNGCHKGMNAQQNLDLSAGKAYQELVNVTAQQCNDGRKLVLPGQPSQSYLIDKIMDVDVCSGTQMPKQTALPAPQIQTIADWICGGALDD